MLPKPPLFMPAWGRYQRGLGAVTADGTYLCTERLPPHHSPPSRLTLRINHMVGYYSLRKLPMRRDFYLKPDQAVLLRIPDPLKM